MKIRVEYKRRAGFVLLSLMFVVGCGGAPKETATGADVSSEDAAEDHQTGAESEGGVAVDGLLGTIPQGEVDRVFDNHMEKILDCYSDALDDIEEIEGRVEIAMQVDASGSVIEAYLRGSDLGSVGAEKCILHRASRFTFERQGGGIAHVTKELILEAPYDPPVPTTWRDSVIQEVIRENEPDVVRCLGGRTGVQLTLYVGDGGVVLSAGAATETYELQEAGYCLAEAARSWKFPDPGSELFKQPISF
ncbi:MAG: AgmX/PglI C-terminal domain-containing protein [Deltaproteobacteria bacterium]|nr:AgmX/PglI C-terminal domain-containing protein [Deltaproteobacteria bacterium]